MRLSPLGFVALLAACAPAQPETVAAPGPDMERPTDAAPAPAPAAVPREDRPGIAVFPFEFGGSMGPEREDLSALAIGIQQMLLTELSQNANLRIVERSRLRELLAEQDLVTEGRVDPRTAARIGRLVGARYTVAGGFSDLFGEMRLDGRIVDSETGELVTSRQVRDQREKIYDMVVELASDITAGVDLPPLPAAAVAERKRRDIPAEAVTLYSRAQVAQDLGQTETAVELYRRIVEEFPQMTEAREALRQIGPV